MSATGAMTTGEGSAVAEWRADPSWTCIDVLSDVHLSEAMPRTFNAWMAHMVNTPADAVVLLGDLFEVWLGDDTRYFAFERQCAEVLTQTAQRKHVAFLAGNRDFLLGDLTLRDCGVQRLGDPTVLAAYGRRWLLTHGDALCLSDLDYQQFRRQVRDPRWQHGFLALPLSERQRLAAGIRAESKRRHGASPAMSPASPESDSSASTTDNGSDLANAGPAAEEFHDIDWPVALQWLAAAGTDTLIHGHTHRPATENLPSGITRHVLSDWDADDASCVPRGDVLRLTSAGVKRVPPTLFGPD